MGRHMSDVDRINVLGIYLKMTESGQRRSQRIRQTVDLFNQRYDKSITCVQVQKLLEKVPYEATAGPGQETRGGHNLIRPAFREAILQELLSTPKEQFSGRKVAKKLGISHATVARILREDLKPVRRNKKATAAAAVPPAVPSTDLNDTSHQNPGPSIIATEPITVTQTAVDHLLPHASEQKLNQLLLPTSDDHSHHPVLQLTSHVES